MGAQKSDTKADESVEKPSKRTTRTDRSKRLLDLVMLLLKARTPVPFRRIREGFESYQTRNIEAGLRAFERDIPLPARIDRNNVEAVIRNGLLLIDLGAKHETPDEGTRSIPIFSRHTSTERTLNCE